LELLACRSIQAQQLVSEPFALHTPLFHRIAGAEAFTTAGKVITSLGPRHSWKRTSYKASEGLYVREQIATAMQLEPDQQNGTEGGWVWV
jgi:hypothetical protein